MYGVECTITLIIDVCMLCNICFLQTTLRQEGLVPPTKRASPRQRDNVVSELKDQRKEIMVPTSTDSEDTRSVTETSESVASERTNSREESQLDQYRESGNDCHHEQALIDDTRVPSQILTLPHHGQIDDRRTLVEEPAVYFDEETPLPLQHGGTKQQGEHQPTNQGERSITVTDIMHIFIVLASSFSKGSIVPSFCCLAKLCVLNYVYTYIHVVISDIRAVLKDLQMLSASLLGMDSNTNQ